MKAIKIGENYYFPASEFNIKYYTQKLVEDKHTTENEIRKILHIVVIESPTFYHQVELYSKEKAFLFISDLIDGFDIDNVIDVDDSKYY